MLRNFALALLMLLLMLGTYSLALAQATLEATSPEDGAVVKELSEIRLTFSEAVTEPSLKLIQEDAEYTLSVSVSETDPTLVIGKVENELKAGDYQVVWTAVSEDGDSLGGNFSIEYKPPVSRTRMIVGTILIITSLTLFIGALIYQRRLPPKQKKGVKPV